MKSEEKKVSTFFKKYRVFIIIILSFLFILFFLEKKLRFPVENGWCDKGDMPCESFWLDGIAMPIKYSLVYIISGVFLILFTTYSLFKLWLKIIIPFSILALIIIADTPALCVGMVCFDRTVIASGFAKLFLILTVLIIISKSIHLWIISRKNKKLV